jgi:hypothetical protein
MQIIQETPIPVPDRTRGRHGGAGIVFASRSLLPDEHGDMALMQVALQVRNGPLLLGSGVEIVATKHHRVRHLV